MQEMKNPCFQHAATVYNFDLYPQYNYHHISFVNSMFYEIEDQNT